MADDRVMTASASPSTPHTQSAAKVLSQAAATVGSGSVPHALVEIPAAWADGTATAMLTTAATAVAMAVVIISAMTLPPSSRQRCGCAETSRRTRPLL